MTQPGDRPARRRSGLLSPIALLGVLVFVVAVVVAGALLARGGTQTSTTQPPSTQQTPADPGKTRARPQSLGLVERRTGSLQAPVQDAAAAAIGGNRAMLLGGLTAADISRADIRIATPRSDRPAGSLPLAVHDAAAVRLGSDVYLFGGGDGRRHADATRSSRRPPGAGVPRVVGRLPAPSSDQAAAAIGGTAYIVGGYTGSTLARHDRRVAAGHGARVWRTLPSPLRYAAVTAAGGRLVIAGGSLADGTASRAVLAFTPGHGRVRRIGRLPAPTTHAAAAALGGVVVRDRRPRRDRRTRRPARSSRSTRAPASRARPARSRRRAPTSPRSSLGGRILLAGGRGASGTAGRASLTPHRAVACRSGPARRHERVASRERLRGRRPRACSTGAARLRAAARLRPEQPERHRRRDRPAHVQGRRALRRRRAAAARRPGVRPEDALRHERPRQQPDADRPAHRQARTRRSRSTTPTTCTSRPTAATRSSSPSACTGSTSATRTPSRSTTRSPFPCAGVDHMDFSADGSYLLASCEFSGQLVKVDVRTERVVGVLDAPGRRGGMPQDVKLSPDGTGLLRRRHDARTASGRSTATA